MGYPLDVAVRYLGSKKRAFVSIGTAFAILGVALGVAALATVMSVTGGFQAQFQEKVLGVNADVLVLKYSTDFREYRRVMDQVAAIPGVIGVAPFSLNPMMLTHGDATATGVMLKGVDPAASLGVGAPPGSVPVLHLPRDIVDGKLDGLRLPGAKPPDRRVPGSSPSALDALDDAADAGAAPPEIDDAVRSVDPGGYRGKDPGIDAPRPAPSSRPLAGADPGDAGVPHGDVEPDGGYHSVLPKDDDLGPDIDPDVCADPAAIAKMPGIVIGVSLAKTLDLKVGQCVTVTSPTIGFSFSGGSLKPPVAKRFRVIAVFDAGFEQYDARFVYADLYEAQAFYDQGDTVMGIELKLDDVHKARQVSAQIGELLANGLYHTMDWEELNRGLFTALRIQQIGMSAVLALIIVVAAFTVVATLIMVVLDKKKEIAVLKAMGATDSALLRVFLYQGGIIGVAGTALGLLLGLFLCKGLLVYGFPLDPKVYFISRLPVLVRWQEFLITGEVALAICLEATILPSLYAAGLRPAEGFREEIGSSDGGRRLGRPLTAWLFLIHAGNALLALLALIQLETNLDLTRQDRWALAAAALMFIAGAVAALAILLWKRWGFYALCALEALAIPPLLLLMTTPSSPPILGLSTHLIGLCLFSVSVIALAATYLTLRRNWRYLD